MPTATAFEDVLQFWFGELDVSGCADEEHAKRWFTHDPAFDEEHAKRWFTHDPAFDEAVRKRFAELYAELSSAEAVVVPETPRACLASVIVLDQFPRNLFRRTPRMFESDARALEVALAGIERGDDRVLRFDETTFLYLPLSHSEDLALQDRSVALFAARRDGVADQRRKLAEESLDFAERHRDIIRRFGRFPHRNVVLDRTSRFDEISFLQEPHSSF